jgi:O-antigen ligase
MLINASVVHFILATHPDVSIDGYFELLKFVLLYFLLRAAIQDRNDLRIAVIAMALGAAYIGYEVTINERGEFSGSRLEQVGAPGADTANALASMLLLVLPLIGSLWINGKKWHKLLVIAAAPLALNVIILCNSRGAFLGLVAGAVAFLMLARGETRKKATRVLLLGGVALYLLLGDPEIFTRFTTTFVGAEERDRSASSRLEFWKAGLVMLTDYPLGDGGDAFKYVHANKYLRQVGSDQEARSLHNGYLTEATDWGVQGLVLKLLFMGNAMLLAYRTCSRCRKAGRIDEALIGVSFLVGAISFLIVCIFGSYLSSEWAYWVAAFLGRYADLYATEEAVGAEARVPLGQIGAVGEQAVGR